MQLVVGPALVLLRVIASAMVAAAVGAITASAALAILGGDRFAWAQSAAGVALAPGLALGCGALAMRLLMPARVELLRRTPEARSASLPTPLVLVIIGLAGAAALQLPAVLAWWNANRALLRTVTDVTADPRGFDIIPAVFLYSTPAVALICLAGFVLTSLVAVSVPVLLLPRALAACVMMHAGLVIGLNEALRALRATGVALQRFVDRASDPDASASLMAWLSRYDLAADEFGGRLFWLLAGYVAALGLAWMLVPRFESEQSHAGPGPEQSDSVPDTDGPRAAMPTAVLNDPAPFAGPQHFEYSTYSVRPRRQWLDMFVWFHREFLIDSIPPSTRARFAFVWRGGTGTIRREPSGPDLFHARPESSSIFDARSYSVVEAATSLAIGSVHALGSDWEIRSPSGQPIAHVLEIERGAGRARFTVKAGAEEVCRIVWGFAGATAFSAELQIEFLPAGDRSVHNALIVALGPILEQRARRTSRRYAAS